MGRSTQYIGLTNKAKRFVKNFTQEHYHLTDGMFGEEVFGSLYFDSETNIKYQEEVQFKPWSSGPMIFTHLRDQYGNIMFSWVEDENIDGEFDRETGKMYV